jgi:DNA-binding response OmpR family regulator
VCGGMAELPRRILIVEDEPRVAAAMRELLDDEYIVDVAQDGEAGLAAASQVRPDLVLLDINMPGMSGLEVLRRLRNRDSSLPVIMITGTDDDFSITTALMRGAFAYIPKPCSGEYLLHLVSAALEGDAPR